MPEESEKSVLGAKGKGGVEERVLFAGRLAPTRTEYRLFQEEGE